MHYAFSFAHFLAVVPRLRRDISLISIINRCYPDCNIKELSNTTGTATKYKQQLRTCIRRFVHLFIAVSARQGCQISLCDVFLGDVNRRRQICFFLLNIVIQKSISSKFTYIWHFKRVGIIVTKFEKSRIQFRCRRRRRCLSPLHCNITVRFSTEHPM